MASKQENLSVLMGAQQKQKFFAEAYIKHKELAKRQREYKEILAKRHKTREDTIIEKSLWTAIDALHYERNELRAQIWVASGAQHQHENRRFLKKIKCHVDCQDNMANDISNLKIAIENMERERSRIDREIYELNRQIVPESQHQQHVARMRKKLGILENQLEVGVRRECIFSAANARLREDLENILHDRAQFNVIYTKMVSHLNSDKKYMADLMEHSVNTFDNCINVSERTNMRVKKIQKEQEARKTEAQGHMRTSAANNVVFTFNNTKAKVRDIAPHQPKELCRRDNYRLFHTRRIDLYNREIEKLLKYTEAHTVLDVIERYQQHESLYYSYFSLDNEREFHITLLNNSVERLYNQVERLKVLNTSRISNQIESITELEEKLKEKQNRSTEVRALLEKDNNLIKKFLEDFQTILSITKTNASPLLELLGDHTQVNLENLRRFTKLLEERLRHVVATVFVSERANKDLTDKDYIIKYIEKTLELQTKIQDIVLTQQCPECAEGEAFTADDTGDGGLFPLNVEEAKKGLFEKVNQPEMQYRLHSISQCRLPRSRLLAAKRNA